MTATKGSTDSYTPTSNTGLTHALGANSPELDHSGDAALSRILATSARAFKFGTAGDSVSGPIESVKVQQVRDFKTKAPVFWTDDRPQEQIIVTVQTDLDEPDVEYGEDDGLRAVYIKSWGPQVRAFRKGVKGLKRLPREGDIFSAAFTGLSTDVDSGSGEPWKIFEYTATRA